MHTHITIHGAREHNLKKQDTPFHFVGSLPVSDYPDLLAVPLSDYAGANLNLTAFTRIERQ